MKRLLLLLILVCLSVSSSLAGIVPDKMKYCGIELTFTEDAKEKISEYVIKMYESPKYFNEVVNRAATYMPFIEEAFTNVGIPQDLKYLAIQESSLKADAVSVSNAVGFWQLKEDAGKEMGLRINDKVDERMHIYRASEAAAMYLSKANDDFDNWVYAVISYYEGPTGAVPYTEPEFYGNKKMTITGDLHWYALKAISHKLAYEEALNIKRQPKVWLEPFASNGEANVKSLCAVYEVSDENFVEYNKWALGKKLPKDEQFTCYIPRINEFYAGHIQDPNKVVGGGTPQLISSDAFASAEENMGDDPEEDGSLNDLNEAEESDPSEPISTVPTFTPEPFEMLPPAPEAASPSFLHTSDYAEFKLKDDLDYGVEYMIYDGSKLMSEIAYMKDIKVDKLYEWNGLLMGMEPKRGSMIRLVKAKKMSYHVVQRGETIYEVAQQHNLSARKIQKKNRMKKHDLTIYEGQKLYLKKKKPKGEKVIILTMPKTEEPEPEPAIVVPPDVEVTEVIEEEKPDSSAQASNETVVEEEKPEPAATTDLGKTIWIDHVVQKGENLWQISKKYGTKVDIIKRINRLEADSLSEGQKLRILAKRELVKGE